MDLKESQIKVQAELLVLNKEGTAKVNETDLKYYTFKYNDEQDCLVLGDGEMFNHSDTPNIGYKLIDYDGRKVMMFYTLTPIKQYAQLFIDYNADTKVKVQDYTVNLIK
jgi:SET domain-containing protein